MLQPKRTKFRKQFKGSIKGLAKGGSDLNFGTYGLKATQPERVTARQPDARGRNPSKCVWVKVKVLSIFGHARSNPAGSCLKLTA